MTTVNRSVRLAPRLLLASALVVAGCLHRQVDPAPAPPVDRPAEIVPISGPPASVLQQPAPAAMVPQEAEPYIDNLTMVNAPVRLILQRLAELGKLDLVIPANLNRTLSVQYVHVPVSVALNDVLRRSGLRLGTGTTGPMPYDTVTVFYRLPANLDSLSVDGIMHRFGISRALAELIVKSRPPR